MTLWAHRDTKAERLVAVLAEKLAASWPEDVLTPVTVIVGSRGMQRWLNHELATAHGSVAGVDFVLPGKGFQDATAEVFKAAGRETPDDDEGVWSGIGLHQRVVRGIRARVGDPSFERVRKYLGELDGPVGPRELAFTTEVASVVERLLYDRPDDSLKWMADPSASKRDQEDASDDPRWLATLLADLQRGSGGVPEPATRLIELRKLRNQDLAPIPTPVFVFGLSSLRPGDKLYLAELARHMDIHLFMLVPSKRWWADIHSRKGERAALKKATSQKEISELLQAFEQANPMLAANGAPSRDLQIWLEDVGYQADEDIDPPAARTRLEVLQQWIDAAEPPGALGERLQEAGLLEADESALPSIEINACHGPLRQCEALRDDLLRRFAADETLEPRHVLVTTPDLATYAPLIAAVFGREQKGESAVPAIPVHIADLGLTDTNPVAAVLLDVIGLVGARVTATTLLDLLGREPVRTKFRIEDEDLGALQDLVVSSGLRWAWDAEDRARHDQPAVDQNTVRFALERLALGVLMPDPGGFEVVPPGAGLGPAAPLDLPSRDQAVRFGTLAAVCHALQRLQHELTTPATSEVWRARLERVVETLCDVPETRAWQRSRVLSTLHDLLPDDEAVEDGAGTPAGTSSPPLEFDAQSIAAILEDAFTVPRGGDRPSTGAVTVCSMEPMRSVPFRVVAMIGMDDGTFPRGSKAPAWSPFAHAKHQEHDRRSLDRHLFLESLLCVREALLIYGRGFESTRGEKVPMSVVVEELHELMTSALGLQAPNDFRRTHPLQPWSETSFEAPERRPYDASWVEAALARQREPKLAGLAATPLDAKWPADAEPPTSLTARALARALENAPKAFLEQTLGISMTDWSTDVLDREPIELNSLDLWKIRDELLGVVRASSGPVDVQPLLQRQRALGVIPFEAGGEVLLQSELENAVVIVEAAEEIGVQRLDDPVGYAFTVEGGHPMTLSTTLPDVRVAEDGRHIHVWMTASNGAKDKLLLEVWISLLIAASTGASVASATVVSGGGVSTTVRAPSTVEARWLLGEAVAVWWRLRREPVPLVPYFSKAVAEAALAETNADPVDLVRGCADRWFDDGDGGTAMSDTAANALFGSMTERDLNERAAWLVGDALRTWVPLISALAETNEMGEEP